MILGNSTNDSAYRFLFGGSNSGKAVNKQSTMQMTAVYACVRILSESIAVLPVHVYKYTDTGGEEKAIKHSLCRFGKKIKFLTYAGSAVRNAMMDLISIAFRLLNSACNLSKTAS